MKQSHKDKIGKANAIINLNKSHGKFILKNGKKLCPKCGKWKLLSEFDKRPERPIGVKPKCKECAKIYRANNPQIYKYIEYRNGAKRRGIFNLLAKTLPLLRR